MFYPKFSRGKESPSPRENDKRLNQTHEGLCSKDAITGRFDPTALERGAKALRDLDGSPNAAKAFELTRLQEVTRQEELKKEVEQLQSARSQLQMERTRLEAEEKRKYLAQQVEQERITAQYKAQLETEAYAKKLQDQQKQNELCLQQQHQQFLRQEQLRKENERQLMQEKFNQLQKEKELDKEVLKLRIHEEAKGRILQQRETLDVHLKEIKAKATEDRQTKLESINTVFSSVGKAGTVLLDDKNKLTALVTGVTALALGIYGARTGTHVLGRYLQRRLGQPSLIRETSRWTFQRHWARFRWPSSTRPSLFTDKLVLPPALAQRLEWTANTLVASRRYGLPFRHILLYGEPGTGKTLFARTLARASGLDYAIMAGGDIGPLGRDAVTKLHEVFAWAKKSRRGLILFIDEAEAFLRKGREDPFALTQDTRNVLSAFLYETGTESKDICIILATNTPQVIDKAVLDRMDEQFEFPLPGWQERLDMIKLFFKEFIISQASQKGMVVDPEVNEQFFEIMAHQTQGLSGRQLAKLVLAMQGAVLGSGLNVLTRNLAETVLQWTRAQQLHQENLCRT